MQKGWLKKAGAFRVEHMPCPRPGSPVDLDAPPKGVLHTIEGSLESGLAVFRRHYAPTFTVGRDRKGNVRILQHIPLGEMAAALVNASGGVETNRVVRVQIEIAGFSKHQPWLPDAGVQAALASLMATLEGAAGIPLTHRNIARNPLKWRHLSGWFGHADVPENTHWDPGELKWASLLTLAKSFLSREPLVRKRPRKTDRAKGYWEWLAWRLGEGKYEQAGPQNPSCRPPVPAEIPKAWWARADAFLRRRQQV